ncbi:Chemotaxis methyltransferase protein (fragment) [uncultured Stenotrophomonas sp.]|uniref:histidine kinase n=1 Tax=uncultured Stenotrophomonas sp. TaxID=165438 RepID=A0A1Y5QBP1_9GAMM
MPVPMSADAGNGCASGGAATPADMAGWLWDAGNDALHWADEGFSLGGYRPGVLAPDLQRLLAQVHVRDRARVCDTLRRAGGEGGEHSCRFRYLLPDGRQRRLLLRTLFRIEAGADAGRVTGTLHDVSDNVDTEKALHESAARFVQFGQASSDVLWIRNARTLHLEYLSQAFDQLYGHERGTMLAHPTLESWTSLILPEDRHRVHAALARVRAGERVTVEYRVRRGDGTIRWMRNTKFPLLDSEGEVVRIGGIGHDATEEKEAAARVQVLFAELQHRTRNLMAVVRSIAERTLAECATLDEFRDAYGSRLAAIARVHTLLSNLDEGQKVTFDRLLHEELKAHGADHGRVVLDGPAGVRLRSTTLQAFALALHELATNAVKYGALADETGRLSVRWRLHRWEDGTKALVMEWSEQSTGPVVPQPRHAGGYGRELIERALPYQLKARTCYRLTRGGVECRVDVPLQESDDVQVPVPERSHA